MSSWFGDRVGQITGQISNFTKEVLTEGTEEVDDYQSELRLAKKRISDLEAQSSSQKLEVNRIEKENGELRSKLESAELEVKNVATRYQSLLAKKEAEIVLLKEKQNDLESDFTHSISESGPTSLSLGDDEDDISDVINSQREINRLRSEVRRLQNQCDRLKNELLANERDEDGYNVTAVLQNKVKDLEVALSAEREHHERELQALDRLHRSQPTDDKSSFEDIEKDSLKKQSERLQEELRSANQRIIQLEECCDGLDRRCENTGLETATLRDELDVCKMKLLENVESGQELRASFMTELDKTKRAVSLHNQIRANTFLHERSALTAQLLKTKCQEEQLEKDLIAIMDALERSSLDTGRLMEDLGDKRSQELTRKILNAFTKDENSADKERLDDDIKSTDSLAWENDPGLHESELERLKQQVNEFELYRNVVETEKKALEDVLVKQRDDLKEKEKAIKNLNSQMAEKLDESIKIEETITEIKELLRNERKEREISQLEKLLQEVETRYAALHSLENDKETAEVKAAKVDEYPNSEIELNNRIFACEEKVNDILLKLDEDNSMKINESVQLEVEMLRARLSEAESLANPDPQLCSLKGQLEESQNTLEVALKNQKSAEIAFEQLKFEYDNKMADFEKIRAEMVILEDRNRKALQFAQELSIQKSLNDELMEKLEKRDEELGWMKNGITSKDIKVNNDDVDERIVEGQADDDNSDNLKKTIEALKREKDELQTTLPSVRAAFQTATMQLADSKQQLSQALSEKEQVSAVLNDKSRENAQLKRENAKLLDSISDLKKKLENAGNIRVKFDSSTIESDNEMSKDTIQKLSLLIRERDQELEMLRQRCDSLGDLLQSSGQDLQTAHQLAQLTQDRAVLTNALQQKHAESVGYHQEVVRLSNTVSKLQTELVELKKRFEEKSDALAKATLDVSELRQVCLKQEECAQELKKKIDIDVNNVDANNLEDDVQEKRQTINKLEKLLAERDATESQLQSHMASLQSQQEKLEEQLLSTKVSLESTLIDLENATSEKDLAKAEKEEALHRAGTLQSEIIELREKATSYQLALNDCKARLESIKKDDERESAWEGHVKGVTQERDKAIRKNADLTNSLEESKNEVTTLKNRETRLQSELERLRAHLIQMEDGHTQDSILASQREAALREKLELAEKTANDRLKTVEGTKSAADSTVKQLRLQISEISRQRDEAYVQNTNLRSQLEQHVTAVKNLQLVLEQFEAERADGESKAYDEVKRYRHDVQQYKDRIRRLESELEEAREGLEAARRLSEQLDRKTEAISALKEEVQNRERMLQHAEEEIARLQVSSDARVDKTVVKNLILGYLHTPASKQPEVLLLIGKILGFTQTEMEQLRANQQHSGWLKGWFGNKPKSSSQGAPTPPSTPLRATSAPPLDQSLSQLFVDFLERESTPLGPPMKLPAEQMASEELSKPRKIPNPFSATIPSLPTETRSGGPTPPLLFKPIDSTQRTLSPIRIVDSPQITTTTTPTTIMQ